MNPLVLAALAALALAPLAGAEYNPDKPPCPPDMMCTTSTPSEEPPKDVAECTEDACKSNAPDAPVDNGSTCMDGEQEGEVCRDDVQYLDGGPSRGGNDGVPAPNERSNEGSAPPPAADPAPKEAPLVAGAILLAAVGAAGLVMGRRR